MIAFPFKDVITILSSYVNSRERKESLKREKGEFIDNYNRVNMSRNQSLTFLIGMGGKEG